MQLQGERVGKGEAFAPCSCTRLADLLRRKNKTPRNRLYFGCFLVLRSPNDVKQKIQETTNNTQTNIQQLINNA